LIKSRQRIKAVHQPFFFEEFSGLPEIYFFGDLLVPLRSFLKNGRFPARPENRLLQGRDKKSKTIVERPAS
jgi:hypothetical protein